MPFIQTCIAVSDISQVGEARRAAARLAEIAGMPEGERGKVGVVVTELATNLVHHATGGQLLLNTLSLNGGTVFEAISIDRGPGMGDPSRCMEDGFSTAGTAGNGLGAVRRLSDEFDLFSQRPGGTVVLSRIRAQSRGSAAMAFGVVCQPAPRETACGDTWRLAERDGGLSFLLADGLGHGPEAATAADVAANAFDANPSAGPTQILEAADMRTRGTRGAAVVVGSVDLHRAVLQYAGVGNVSGHLQQFTPEPASRGLFSHNGTLGVAVRKLQQFDYPLVGSPLIILHSDGLHARWSLLNYPGLSQRHPAVIAGVLYRDFIRGRDDVTVMVIRCGGL